MASVGYFIAAVYAFILFSESGEAFILHDTYSLFGVYFAARGFAHLELTARDSDARGPSKVGMDTDEIVFEDDL